MNGGELVGIEREGLSDEKGKEKRVSQFHERTKRPQPDASCRQLAAGIGPVRLREPDSWLNSLRLSLPLQFVALAGVPEDHAVHSA